MRRYTDEIGPPAFASVGSASSDSPGFSLRKVTRIPGSRIVADQPCALANALIKAWRCCRCLSLTGQTQDKSFSKIMQDLCVFSLLMIFSASNSMVFFISRLEVAQDYFYVNSVSTFARKTPRNFFSGSEMVWEGRTMAANISPGELEQLRGTFPEELRALRPQATILSM